MDNSHELLHKFTYVSVSYYTGLTPVRFEDCKPRPEDRRVERSPEGVYEYADGYSCPDLGCFVEPSPPLAHPSPSVLIISIVTFLSPSLVCTHTPVSGVYRVGTSEPGKVWNCEITLDSLKRGLVSRKIFLSRWNGETTRTGCPVT